MASLALTFVLAAAALSPAKAAGDNAGAPAKAADETSKAPDKPAGKGTEIKLGYVVQATDALLPISRLDIPPKDVGIDGAKLGVSYNNTTGKFIHQTYTLDVEHVKAKGDPLPALKKLIGSGHHFILVDAPADTLLKMADAAKGKDVMLFNVSAEDNRLRQKDCRANVFHTAPSRAMLADALAQYLIWKKWNKWFLVEGQFPADKDYAEAIKHAAKKFGGKIVEEREYDYKPGARRTDSGYSQVQRQLPTFLQGAPDYDVLIVADESQVFGPYMPYRTWQPRPVAGTQGLYATTWHAAHEQWAATQMNNRFHDEFDRWMWPLDANAWIAARSVGDAGARAGSTDFKTMRDYIAGPDFEVAAFKGQGLNYRKWNHQLRTPIILATENIPVSVSPQQGFLHPGEEVDSLGIDEPETKCSF